MYEYEYSSKGDKMWFINGFVQQVSFQMWFLYFCLWFSFWKIDILSKWFCEYSFLSDYVYEMSYYSMMIHVKSKL